MRWSVVVLWLVATAASAQESYLQADFRREGERVSDACKGFSFSAIPGCGIELFTDHPLHIAAGSMPALNGFAAGGAFVTSWNTTNWRMSWDVDAVGSSNASWRVGGYMKLVHTPVEIIGVTMPSAGSEGSAGKSKKPKLAVHPYTVFNLYAQTISLNHLNYLEGNNIMPTGASVFGMTQTIVGVNAIKPVFEWAAIRNLNLALLGEVNGRFVSIRGEDGQSLPSIVQADPLAAELRSQPGYLQLAQGFRIKPVIADHLEFNYLGNFEEFLAPSNSNYSFLRWTVDLNHTYYLYGYTKSGRAIKNTEQNGPDSCSHGDEKCPEVSHSKNLNGSLGVRLLLSESINSATDTLPFYFQKTLGGSDINGAMALGSYQDYQFRAPNLLLLEQNFEHSIWGPFGLKLMADEGRAALTRGDIGLTHLRHSYAGGLTLRAGGFPMVSIMFAWGGPEGHHNIFNMNSSLLGGSARPSLD